ncbi:hypothetical protein RclHR1_30190001 [Rhizophagus clarus]|uniref:Uncharacterized protein n=1 Tax=Rhizophagus clarus TaxID=94130 RepID=A0A2Z6R9E4_9GLOM|nr:hypothetical protein RclHR1_30190001 [Rhizophagus clarus]
MENLEDPIHQSDASINFDVLDSNSIGSLDDELLATLSRNLTPIPVTPLTKSQKRSAKKKALTFNQSLLSPPSTPYKQQLKRDSKPQSTPIDNGKKLKQKETDNNTLKNGNIIITRYFSQDQEQAYLLDLVVYDILAKWDNYTPSK